MSVKNYRFVSPGVFVNEIDNSQAPASPAGIGPVVIGRAASGPALRPVTVSSFEEFVNIFGTPAPGAAGGDVWREGSNKSSTTYGMYAAQAYLRNSSPLTYIRLLGANSSDADPTNDGNAGWSAAGDAWGLVVFESASAGNTVEGALAAVFYATTSSVSFKLQGQILTGSIEATGSEITDTDAIIGAVGPNKEFKLVIEEYSTGNNLTASFNFTKTDSRYIRKVFNTNPELTDSETTDSAALVNYFLGESFDRHLSANITSNQEAETFAAIVKLEKSAGDVLEGGSFKAPLQSAQTPSVISCRLSPSDTPTNLFHFEALEQPGDWSNRNIKISIQDIKRSTNDSTDYGTFSVVVRHLSDSDNVVRVIEQFNGCDLNPNSVNYVARKIGTQQREWDTESRRLRLEGDWPNNSSHIRIVMNSAVDNGSTNASLLPFGFKGIVKYDDEDASAVAGNGNWIVSSSALPVGMSGSIAFYASGTVTSSVVYPAPELRVNASDGGLNNITDAYFGFQTADGAGSTVFARSTIDLLRPRGGMVGGMFSGASATNSSSLSQDFTLDDISSSAGVWIADSHNDSDPGSGSLTYANGAVAGVLDAGFDRFTVPMYGGFDGVNITDMDAFANINIGLDEVTSYTLSTLRRTIDTIADPETVQMNLATIPGLTNEGLTTHLVNTCEDRADALAIIDLPEAFQPREEDTSVARLNEPSTITTLINGLHSRGLNSSYGCTYYPWVRARDTINGAMVWLPPSIPALGTLSSSQRKTQVWFAPAGFNRGGLTEGSAGIPVVDVAHQLRRKDRDDLYTANINPIAKFPAEGIVIFGQKTLQVTPSALDRINVRRLMIFVKKRISQIAATLLFDPNVQQTWLRFTSQVNPFLADVKTNFGLSDFKVVLDTTTTTPDLVDRNIMYAQIFLKPTRAIEFIAIDFNISQTGASFED
jgi:hypothetical protein